MQIRNEIKILAPREQVFQALLDVETLKKSIPGCENLEELENQKYTATILSKVGPLKIRFKGEAQLLEVLEPERYTIAGEGTGGAAGRAKVRAHVTLEELNESTLLKYDVNAEVGGKLAQLGGSLIKNTAEKLAMQFFQTFNDEVIGSNSLPTPSTPPPTRSDRNSYKLLIIGSLLLLTIAVFLLL